MDSGNSASIQSSSGGDDEFDSSRQGEAISSMFNPFGSISAPNPQFLARENSNFLDDSIWSVGGLRPLSHQNQNLNNFPNFGGLDPTPSSSSTMQQSSFPIQPPSVPQQTEFDGGGGHATNQLSAVTKNPKKRTRASRRAPTTVLTTDTTNFRQMVQEFTGIPSSPFAAGTSPYSRRFDLFSPAAALRLGGGHFDTLGPLYSLRPQFPPPSSSPLLNSTMVDSIVPSTNINVNPNSANHLLTLQNRANINALQLGGNNPSTAAIFGGFPRDDHHPSIASSQVAAAVGSRTATTTVRNHNHNNDNDEADRWKRGGETVRRNRHDDGEEEENVVTTTFDGNIDNTRHHQHQLSGHSTNLSSNNNILGQKGGIGNGGSSSSSRAHQGTLAPWIYPSQ